MTSEPPKPALAPHPMTEPTAAHDKSQDRPPRSSSEHVPRHSADRRPLVGVAIVLAALLFLTTAGLLYLRWATMREPMCVFIVEAPEALRGAEVTVEGVNLPKPHTAMVGVGGRLALPFYLDYGTYTVRVTLNDALVFETDVALTRERPWQKMDLSKLPLPPSQASGDESASAPTTASAPLFTPQETQRLPTLTPPSGGSRLSP